MYAAADNPLLLPLVHVGSFRGRPVVPRDQVTTEMWVHICLDVTKLYLESIGDQQKYTKRNLRQTQEDENNVTDANVKHV